MTNPPPDSAEALQAILPVPRETEERLARYVALLADWQTRMNLVAPSTLTQVWTRHIADSAQLLPLAPGARIWADLGSGAGFPGLVIAILLHNEPSARVHLVESIGKKGAFLRAVVEETGAPATVHHGRAEDVLPRLGPLDVVTARAVAPLDTLLRLAHGPLSKGALGLFPKGRNAVEELTLARASWTLAADLVPSRTDPEARIVVIRSAVASKGGAHGRTPR